MMDIFELEEELQKKTEEIVELRKRNLELKKTLQIKEEKIVDLNSELDKYRSIFNRQHSNPQNNLPTKLSNDTNTRSRGLGISAEPHTHDISGGVELIKIPKSAQSQELIRKAIIENEFMGNLSDGQIRSIIDCMKPVTFPANSIIIKEGDVGSVVYVLEEGALTVSKNGKFLREIIKETTFGELAILYNCTRTATIQTTVPCKLWSIDRKIFQSIMMKTGLMKQKENFDLLKTVPSFQTFSDDKLQKIADMLEEMYYNNGEYIIRQGGRGNTFYIIAKGKVKVSKSDNVGEPETFIRFMNRGEWFGEKALINEDVRTANIIADDPDGVRCLVLDRESYLQFFGSNFLQRTYPDDKEEVVKKPSVLPQNTSVKDFEMVAVIGIGGFGKVELVKLKSDNNKSFALKKMKIKHVIKTRQQEHVMNEKNILSQTSCPFIVELYKTFQDHKYLYMVMEACLGGELWSILRDKMRFDENTTRFYISSVVEAFSYLHHKSIVYRDLKPENILLDNTGYIKLTDFGFAKKVRPGRKTWTFCGTPEYVAPEVILNKGHDHGADLWSLGILIYELLTGIPPFYESDPMKVYNLILKGIDAVRFERTSKNSQNLIKKLCRDNPNDRIGYAGEGIKACQKHIWFESFNWDGLTSRTLPAPIIPNISSPIDHKNFDHYSTGSNGSPEDNEPNIGWNYEF